MSTRGTAFRSTRWMNPKMLSKRKSSVWSMMPLLRAGRPACGSPLRRGPADVPGPFPPPSGGGSGWTRVQNEWIKPLVKPVKEGGRRDITGSACWISPRTMCRRLMKEKAMTKQCGPAIPGYPREPAPARSAGQRPIPRSTPPLKPAGFSTGSPRNGHPGWRAPYSATLARRFSCSVNR
jgi:hypothetical protein